MLLSQSFFSHDALTVARELLGKKIEYKNCSGMIVETEAYMDDPASHAYSLTPRSRLMFETYGHVYVYFIYGNSYCLNFTTNQDSQGAVLIRALEPLERIAEMKVRRKTENIRNLCSGPGKLCQAFGITKELNATAVNSELTVSEFQNFTDEKIISAPRIGIKKAADLPWRFYVQGNEFVSK